MRFLVTTVGGVEKPAVIKLIRRKFPTAWILGVDVNPEAVGASLCDKFVKVPRGDDALYSNAIRALAEAYGIDVVLPMSDEENTALSENRHRFDGRGVKLLCGYAPQTRAGFSKIETMKWLAADGETLELMPMWRVPEDAWSFNDALFELGFPEKEVVVKPDQAHGSRGMRVITTRVKETEGWLGSKAAVHASRQHVLDMLKKRGKFDDVILMEYLPGESYSIDLLADNGRLVACVPHRRIGWRWGQVDAAVMEHSDEIWEAAEAVARRMRIHSLSNVEMNRDEDSRLKVIEVNPRASATLAQNVMTGVDLLELAVRQAFGERLAPVRIERPVRYALFYDHVAAEVLAE